jgi:hypothetical protein
MTIEQNQILEWKRQQRFHIEKCDLHKASIKGESILPVSPQSDESLRVELELTAAKHKAKYDRLESLIQAAHHSAPKPRTLKFHAKVDDEKQKTCTIWITDDNQDVAEKTSGMKVRDIQDFFMKHPSLMLGGHPYDFSTWLVTREHEEVFIDDDLTAYWELGLKFDNK